MNLLTIAKWEFARRISWLKYVFSVYIVLLLAGLFLTRMGYGNNYYDGGDLHSLSTFVQSLIIFVAAYIMIFWPTFSAFSELRGKHMSLEGMRGYSFTDTAIVKIILNILLVSLCYGMLLFVAEFPTKMDNSITSFIGFVDMSFIELLFYTAVLSPVIAMFSVIAGASIPKWSSFSLILAVVLYCGIGGAILKITVSPIYSDVTTVIQCVTAVLLFLASCWLYDNKCEITA